MSDSLTVYTILALFGCLLSGLLLSWLLYRNAEHLNKNTRYALTGARALIITTIAFLLFFPLLRSISYELERPIIIIGQDNSISVGAIKPPGFNQAAYEKDLQHLSEQLSSKFEVKIYSFSDNVESGFDFSNKGKISNAAKFIDKLNDELLNRNVGAVVIASDGIFNRGGSPLDDLNKLKAPVYTIALGDTIPKRDLLIANVNSNDIVYLDNEFTAEVQVQAFESNGSQAVLKVLQNGKELQRQSIPINANPFVKTLPVKIKASKLGLQKYTILLSTLPDEISTRNNSQLLFVDVIDAKQKVLIAAAAPHPDITVFKQAISANQRYEVKVAIAEDLNTLNPKDYGLVILYQLPVASNIGQLFLNKLKESNTSIWYILGAQSNLAAFNQFQNVLIYNGDASILRETYSTVNAGFTSFDISDSELKSISRFDPLLAPFGTVKINSESSIALNQRIGKINTQYPQLLFSSENGRKVGYLIGEGVYKWKLGEALDGSTESVTNSLISKSVQYLSVKDDKRKFKAYTLKNTFDENENITVNALLYNDSYVAVNKPEVNIQIKNENGKAYKFLFSRTEAAYQLDAGTLPPGSYTYVASTEFGNKEFKVSGIFYVNTIVAEYQQTIANHQLLGSMASQSNGKMYMPKDLMKILKDIERNDEIKTLSYEDRKYEELINFKWLFVMIMLLLTMEWFFRKRNGEI
ncbi:hypothetical protein [Pedobacter sp. JCM 36344]|uniref:hypothetical protein n=1 Tax=Pedobacter sp. JCM 36344 TaxID=3374280 RepID=UPI00397A046D